MYLLSIPHQDEDVNLTVWMTDQFFPEVCWWMLCLDQVCDVMVRKDSHGNEKEGFEEEVWSALGSK